MGGFYYMAHLNTHTHTHTHTHMQASMLSLREKTGKDKWEKSKCQAGGSLWNMTGNIVSLEQRGTDAMILINGFSDPAEIFILRQDDILSPCRLPWHKWHLMTLLFYVKMFQFQICRAKLPTWIPTVHQQWQCSQEAPLQPSFHLCVSVLLCCPKEGSMCISTLTHSILMWLIKGEGDIGGDTHWHTPHTSSNTSSTHDCTDSPNGSQCPRPHRSHCDDITSDWAVTILLLLMPLLWHPC